MRPTLMAAPFSYSKVSDTSRPPFGQAAAMEGLERITLSFVKTDGEWLFHVEPESFSKYIVASTEVSESYNLKQAVPA